MTDYVDILQRVARVLEQRKAESTQDSYVAGLYSRGLEAILDKVDEEAAETVAAARAGDHEQLIHETADLWFHLLVMLAHQGLGPEDVFNELDRRFGVSGLAEKAARNR